MTVVSVNDVAVKITSDPEHNGKLVGMFCFHPNSVRRDCEMAYSLEYGQKVFRTYKELQGFVGGMK